jgi:hypothetical protein
VLLDSGQQFDGIGDLVLNIAQLGNRLFRSCDEKFSKISEKNYRKVMTLLSCSSTKIWSVYSKYSGFSPDLYFLNTVVAPAKLVYKFTNSFGIMRKIRDTSLSMHCKN